MAALAEAPAAFRINRALPHSGVALGQIKLALKPIPVTIETTSMKSTVFWWSGVL